MLLAELELLHQVIKQMGALLKVKGRSRETKPVCESIRAACQQGRPLAFRERLLSEWSGYYSLLAQPETLLLRSDGIESYLGKYKLKQNGDAGTDGSVALKTSPKSP